MSKPNVIYLLIDSNQYFINRFLETPSGQWIKKLGETGKIKIILPSIVEMEHRSHLKEELVTTLAAIDLVKNSFSFLKKIPKDFCNDFDNAREEYIKMTNERVEDFFSNSFFIKEDSFFEHSKDVYNDYFSGGGNFKKPKDRKDLPDGYIYQCLKKHHSNIYLVGGDQQLTGKSSLLDNVTTVSTIEDFLQIEDISRIVTKIQNEESIKKRRDELTLRFAFLLAESDSAFKFYLQRNFATRFHNMELDDEFVLVQVVSVSGIELPDFNEYEFNLIPDKTLSIKFNAKISCSYNKIKTKYFNSRYFDIEHILPVNFSTDDIPEISIRHNAFESSMEAVFPKTNFELGVALNRLKHLGAKDDLFDYRFDELNVEFTLQYNDKGFMGASDNESIEGRSELLPENSKYSSYFTKLLPRRSVGKMFKITNIKILNQ